MNRIALCILLLVTTASVTQGKTFQERPDWAHFFNDAGVDGTVVVVDERMNNFWVYNEERAKIRISPASTFKIPHALFALDSHVVRDEFQVFPWDGVKRHFVPHNRDQTIRSSMRDSVVWVYQQFAKAIGEKKEKEYLNKINYGNKSLSNNISQFWLDESLKISAFEQVSFLQNLYRNHLPFLIEHQRLVKDIIIVEAQKNWILRAKTGTFGHPKHFSGWYVGWVEQPDGPVFFACNIDFADWGSLNKRVEIPLSILRSMKALPSNKANAADAKSSAAD